MTRSSQPRTRWIRNQARLGVAALLGLVFLTATASADPKLRCGSPTKSDGLVTITIILQKGDETHTIVIRDVSFNQGYPAADKAEFIAQFITQGEDPNHTYITATHAEGSDEVQLHGENDWSIAGHAIGQDGTGEPDWLTYDGASTGAEALCSLSGTATGTSPLGGPGLVGIQAFGGQAMVATAPGMPAQAVESMLLQQLMSQGIPARWAQANDFTGSFLGMEHDALVLFIAPPTAGAIGTLFESVADEGLQLDILAVADPPDPTSKVVSMSRGPRLRLDVCPSVFSDGLVSIRYDSGSRGRFARITAHDLLGRCLGTLLLDPAGGAGTLTWDGSTLDHRPLPAGVYFLRLETAGETTVRRVVRTQ
jgi:hypothetical protein